jgi:hypothetical protein
MCQIPLMFILGFEYDILFFPASEKKGGRGISHLLYREQNGCA